MIFQTCDMMALLDAEKKSLKNVQIPEILYGQKKRTQLRKPEQVATAWYLLNERGNQ